MNASDETPEMDGRGYDPARLLLELASERLVLPVWMVFEGRRLKITRLNKAGVMQGLYLAAEMASAGEVLTTDDTEGTDDEQGR